MFINPSLWSNSSNLNSFNDLSPFPLDISPAKNKAGHKLLSMKILQRFHTTLLPPSGQMTSFLWGRSLWGPARSSAIKTHANNTRSRPCPVFSLPFKAWELPQRRASFSSTFTHAHTAHVWFQTAAMPAQTSNPGNGREGRRIHTQLLEGGAAPGSQHSLSPAPGARKSRWFSEQSCKWPTEQTTNTTRQKENEFHSAA